MEDKILVRQVLSGDQAAFRQLIRQHKRLVGHVIWRLVDDEMDREELCQDVFVKVYEKLSGFKFDAKLSTWIATIAYRTALNYLKKKKRKVVEEDLEKVNFELGTFHDHTESADYAKFVHHIIDQMPTVYKTILTLYHLDGFSYPEMVEVTGLPEGTVKNYLFRARKKLKALAEPYIGKEIHLT